MVHCICCPRGWLSYPITPSLQSHSPFQYLCTEPSSLSRAQLTPAVAFDNPQNYNHQAKRYADSLDNAVWTNQFDNQANRGAHILTTGPEIWEQTNGGQLDAFICSTGTGGTLAGVTRYLKEKSDGRVEGWLADPPGSVLYRLIEHGKAEREGTGSITEGELVRG